MDLNRTRPATPTRSVSEAVARPDERQKNPVLEEDEIDRILADSFPASDAPPWTLGVAPRNAR